METLCLYNRMDSQLDISIHFHKCHFTLEYNYKFDTNAMRALGVNCPSVKSLYLFFPSLNDKDVEVSLMQPHKFLVS